MRLTGAALALALAVPSSGQQAEHRNTFAVDTQVVMLDLVVRGKQGRSVRDLRPDEVTVLEDGQPQQILEFRYVGTASSVGVEAGDAAPTVMQRGAGPDAASPTAAVNLVTLVFDRLGPEGRGIANQAARQFLDQPERENLWISVFYVGSGLRLVQQFTTDRDSLREAVERATGVAEESLDSPGENRGRGNPNADAGRLQLDQASTGTGPPSGGLGDAAVEAAMRDMEARALAMTRSLRRQQKGTSSIYGLLSLAKQQQSLAGRKTLLYFSEGLEVPPQVEGAYRATISEANRSNVSIYTVDARGLRTTSDVGKSRETLLDAMRTSQRQARKRGGATTRAEILIADTAEESLRADVQGTLGALADETGGVLIANTNDMSKGMAKVASDLEGYYEVVYAPSKLGFDGEFRKIGVKVKRKGVKVQARSGYFALPPGEGDTFLPYQVPLAAALRAEKAPRDFPQRRLAYHFGREGQGRLHTLVMEVPLRHMEFEEQDDSLRVHFSFMARLRDRDGELVEQFSQDSPIEIPEDRRAALEQGNAVFTRSFRLSPGLYTLETAAVDQFGKTSSVMRSRLVVPVEGEAPELSSLALIKRTEQLAAGVLETDDVFRVGETRIVPHVEEPEYLQVDTLLLFFVAFPKGEEKPEMALEFRRDGQLMARSGVDLPEPDERGWIPYIAPVPARNLEPGRYEVRAVLRQGSIGSVERSFFTISAPPNANTEAAGGAGS